MPGVPAMPRADDGHHGDAAARGDAVDEPGLDLARGTRGAARRRARSDSASGSVKPIELSDEDWKIVETETPAACTAANVRAAMPGTPIRPLPATVTSAWLRIVASALTGYSSSVRRARDLGAGLRRVEERAHVQRDPAAVERDERARVQHLGAEVRHLRGLAVVQSAAAGARRAPARGSAVRMPGTSFHSTTRAAPSARASSVAVRSEPPRPSVVRRAVGRRRR